MTSSNGQVRTRHAASFVLLAGVPADTQRMRRIATLLLGQHDDQHRMAEVEKAMDRARGISAIGILAVVPLFTADKGLWTLLLASCWIGWSVFVRGRMRVSRNPGVWNLSLTCVTQLVFAIGAIGTGGPTSPVMLWLVLPLVTAPARYPTRGVIVSVAFTALCLAAVALSHGLDGLLHAPQTAAITLSAGIGSLAYALALRSAENNQRFAASVDPLTGLRNRAALRQRFATVRDEAVELDAPVGLLVCDLDHFKAINDSHGHDAGDEVLVDVAAMIRDAIPPEAAAFRLGGEEFVVLLPGIEQAELERAGERIRERVADGAPGGLKVTLSIGATLATGDAIDEPAMFRVADAALYRAKRGGRDRVVIAEPQSAELRPAA